MELQRKLRRLDEQQARAVYAILREQAGAGSGVDDEYSFVIEFTAEHPTNEWRFCGSLGFGGKFRFPRMTVDCYPEDATDDRRATIGRTNERLAELRAQFEKATEAGSTE